MTKENQELLQAIGQMIDEKLDARFAEYDKKMDARFAEYDEKFVTWKDEIVKEAVHQAGVLMETEFRREFELLSEKIDSAMDNKASYESLEDLTDRVDVLENFSHNHARRIAKLEKAVANL